MFMRKWYICSILICLIYCESLYSKEFDPLTDIIAWADDPEIAELIDSSNIKATRTVTKKAVLDFLFQLKVPQLLQQNFFLRSNNIISRSLLDYPEYLPFRHEKDKNAVFVDLFYNQTSRGFFTKNSSNICSYLAIGNESFQEALAIFLERAEVVLETPPPNEILEILDLFATFTVQERRFGLMIGGKGAFNRWHIYVMTPWYYLERNHFVNDRVQDDIRELTEQLSGAGQEDAKEKEFADQHLISDKFGFGDTRIYFDYPLIKNKILNTRLGALATIPTAFAMKKGLRGSHFKRVINRPILDLLAIFDLGTQGKFAQAQDVAVPFFFEALDNLSAILLDRPMGNGGHFGLGIFLKNRSPITRYIKQDWARRLIWRSFMSLEYLFPATEQRSFVLPAIIKDFTARDFDTFNYPNDQAQINDNFNFLEQQITDRLFPVTYDTKVAPGWIFRSSSQLCYEGEYSGFTLGTDTYVRTKEKFKHIFKCPGNQSLIDICNARAPFAYQSKLVASFFFKIHQPDKLWTLSFIGDYTFMFKGIGNDYLLGFNVDVIF
jgi:hypothetical protein